MASSPDRFRLIATIFTGDELDVREVIVEERISGLFSIRLRVVSRNPDIDFDAVMGQAAAFEIRGGSSGEEQLRLWTGVCRELDQVRVEDTGLSTYSLEIVPNLWLLSQRRNHRMFQGFSDVEVALTVLSDWGSRRSSPSRRPKKGGSTGSNTVGPTMTSCVVCSKRPGSPSGSRPRVTRASSSSPTLRSRTRRDSPRSRSATRRPSQISSTSRG